MKSPAQIAYGRRLKDFLLRSAESLQPVPQDLLGAEEKEVKQLATCQDAGKRLDLHTKVLPELHEGDYVQLQNLVGHHPPNSDRTGVIVFNNGFSNYSFKLIGSSRITKRNRASLQTIDPRSILPIWFGLAFLRIRIPCCDPTTNDLKCRVDSG